MIKKLISALLVFLLTCGLASADFSSIQRIPFRYNTTPDITSTSTASLTLAATIEPGDLLLIIAWGTGTPADVTPSGFTEIETAAASSTRISLHYKIATGSEDGTSVSTINGTQDRAIGLRFPTSPARSTGDVGGTATIAWATSGITIQTTNPAAETAAVSGTGPPLIAFCLFTEMSGGALSGVTSSIPATGSTTVTATEWRWFFFPEAGLNSDFTCDEADGGTNGIVSYWVTAMGFK